MIKNLICWLWGHKVIHKAFTGNVIRGPDRLTGMESQITLYKYERTPFCTRCGKDVS